MASSLFQKQSPGFRNLPASDGPALRVAVAGVGGYAGGELARLLLRHPRLSGAVPLFLGRSDGGSAATQSVSLADLHPGIAAAPEAEVAPFTWDLLERHRTELLFLATPHEQSRSWVPGAIERGIRVIDLSGAWRLQHSENRDVYGLADSDTAFAARLQEEAVYGSPELHKNRITTAHLVANPGCYATSIILALAPLVQAKLIDLSAGIVCDSKSGVSGAGKTPSANTHFMYAADNLSAYSVFGHRHTGELLEQLHLTNEQIRFTPHLLPIPRGILSTLYFRLLEETSGSALLERMQTFHRDAPFVRLRKPGTLPQIQHVVRTNFCDIGLVLDADRKRIVMISCLDNLLKGAAGQAVQNMNLMCGWDETEGLL